MTTESHSKIFLCYRQYNNSTTNAVLRITRYSNISRAWNQGESPFPPNRPSNYTFEAPWPWRHPPGGELLLFGKLYDVGRSVVDPQSWRYASLPCVPPWQGHRAMCTQATFNHRLETRKNQNHNSIRRQQNGFMSCWVPATFLSHVPPQKTHMNCTNVSEE